MVTDYPFWNTWHFLGFELRFFANQPLPLEILTEQYLYSNAADSAILRDRFDFYVAIVADDGGDVSRNTTLHHRYEASTGRLQLSYLKGAIQVSVDYRTKTVRASIMERALLYRAALSNWVFTIPLSELLKLHQIYLIHAACLTKGGGGILFAGRSGSGKTTLSIGLLTAGWQLISDDESFLQGETEFWAYGGPEKAKVSWTSWRRFGYYLGERERFNGKQIIHLGDYFPGQLRPRQRLSAICFVEQAERIALHALDPIQAYQNLLSVAFLNSEPQLSRRTNDFLYRLSRTLPAYRLQCNLDFRALDQLLIDYSINPENTD